MPKRRQKFEIRPMTRDDFIEVHEMAQPEGWLVNDNMLDAWFSENPRGCHVAVTKDTGVVIGSIMVPIYCNPIDKEDSIEWMPNPAEEEVKTDGPFQQTQEAQESSSDEQDTASSSYKDSSSADNSAKEDSMNDSSGKNDSTDDAVAESSVTNESDEASAKEEGAEESSGMSYSDEASAKEDLPEESSGMNDSHESSHKVDASSESSGMNESDETSTKTDTSEESSGMNYSDEASAKADASEESSGMNYSDEASAKEEASSESSGINDSKKGSPKVEAANESSLDDSSECSPKEEAPAESSGMNDSNEASAKADASEESSGMNYSDEATAKEEATSESSGMDDSKKASGKEEAAEQVSGMSTDKASAKEKVPEKSSVMNVSDEATAKEQSQTKSSGMNESENVPAQEKDAEESSGIDKSKIGSPKEKDTAESSETNDSSQVTAQTEGVSDEDCAQNDSFKSVQEECVEASNPSVKCDSPPQDDDGRNSSSDYASAQEGDVEESSEQNDSDVSSAKATAKVSDRDEITEANNNSIANKDDEATSAVGLSETKKLPASDEETPAEEQKEQEKGDTRPATSVLSTDKPVTKFAIPTMFVVRPNWRHLGVGRLLIEKVKSQLGKCYYGFTCSHSLVDRYYCSPDYGLRYKHFEIITYVGNYSAGKLPEARYENVVKLDKRSTDYCMFHELWDYDQKFHCISRPDFLLKWIDCRSMQVYIARNERGNISGFGCIQRIVGYPFFYIGPLYCDDDCIALAILEKMLPMVPPKRKIMLHCANNLAHDQFMSGFANAIGLQKKPYGQRLYSECPLEFNNNEEFNDNLDNIYCLTYGDGCIA